MALRFGEFELDDEQRQLFCRGTPVHLEPKAFELLALLLRHRPKALAKQAIRDAIWPGTHVSESSLAGLVLDLRVALRDEQARPRFIRTVRGYGYAFCAAAVEGLAPAPSSSFRWCALWAGREIPLPDGTHLIGRGEGCLIRLGSARVSRCHARLVVAPDGVTVEDLGSRNGTWVGGRRVEGRVALDDGAEFHVATETIRLLATGSDASTLSSSDEGASD
ncbi:MAG TPA: FHA domain-containing protein [Coriobacteriia bacterium]